MGRERAGLDDHDSGVRTRYTSVPLLEHSYMVVETTSLTWSRSLALSLSPTQLQEPALFHSMSFYIAEHLTSPSMSDFVFLVNTAGGKVSTSRPEPLESETSSSSSDSDSADAGAGKEVSTRPLAETVPRAVVCSTCGRLHLHHAAGCQPAQSTSRHGRAIRPPQPAHAFESTMECPACHTSTTVSDAPFGDVLVVVDGTLHKAAPAASSRLRRDVVPASVSAGRLVVSHTWLIESLSAGEQLPIQQFLR